MQTPAPHFETLTPATAFAYAQWLANLCNDVMSGPLVLTYDEGCPMYVAPLSMGGTVNVYHDGVKVYGEA